MLIRGKNAAPYLKKLGHKISIFEDEVGEAIYYCNICDNYFLEADDYSTFYTSHKVNSFGDIEMKYYFTLPDKIMDIKNLKILNCYEILIKDIIE
jgi:hypothetical protein